MRAQINNYTAWIKVNGEETLQHSIEYSPDGTVATCWICSEAGKNFSVYWRDSLREFSSSGCVYVDGMTSHGKLLSGSKLDGDGIAHRNGFRTSATTKRPFMFSELELTDDDQYLHNPTSPELGEIKLVIYRCELKAGTKPNVYSKFSEPEKIHERSKKAMGHRCKFGTEMPCRASTYSIQSKHVGKLATFVFKYRPLAQLQANGIVPREKRKREISNEIIDLTLDEPSLLERRPEIRVRKRVKEEPGTSRVKKEDVAFGGGRSHQRQPGEVIDLT